MVHLLPSGSVYYPRWLRAPVPSGGQLSTTAVLHKVAKRPHSTKVGPWVSDLPFGDQQKVSSLLSWSYAASPDGSLHGKSVTVADSHQNRILYKWVKLKQLEHSGTLRMCSMWSFLSRQSLPQQHVSLDLKHCVQQPLMQFSLCLCCTVLDSSLKLFPRPLAAIPLQGSTAKNNPGPLTSVLSLLPRWWAHLSSQLAPFLISFSSCTVHQVLGKKNCWIT